MASRNDDSVSGDSDTEDTYIFQAEDYSFFTNSDEKNNIYLGRSPVSLSIPTPRFRSTVLRLVGLCVVALCLGSFGVEVLRQEAVGGALMRVGTCLQGTTDYELSRTQGIMQQTLAATGEEDDDDPRKYVNGSPTDSFRGTCKASLVSDLVSYSIVLLKITSSVRSSILRLGHMQDGVSALSAQSSQPASDRYTSRAS